MWYGNVVGCQFSCHALLNDHKFLYVFITALLIGYDNNNNNGYF